MLATFLFEFRPTDKICAVPHAATAFANRGQYQNALVIPRWTDPAHDKICVAWAREMAHKFNAEMERGKRDGDIKMKVEGVGQYGNYDGEILFLTEELRSPDEYDLADSSSPK